MMADSPRLLNPWLSAYRRVGASEQLTWRYPLCQSDSVAFAHGSGSGRHSPRNRYVAQTLNGYNFATLLADLLTEEEEIIDMQTRHLRFDIPMLADRLIDIASWLGREPQTKAPENRVVRREYRRGRRIDRCRAPSGKRHRLWCREEGDRIWQGMILSQVIAPVLLIVGENDPQVHRAERMGRARAPQRPVEAGNSAGRDASYSKSPVPWKSAALLAGQLVSAIMSARD